MRHLPTIIVLLWASAAALAAGDPMQPPEKPKAYVVIFDFVVTGSDHNAVDLDAGLAMAESIQIKLRRHEEYKVTDPLTTRENSPALGIGADKQKVIALMTTAVGCNLGVYGTLRKGPGQHDYTLEARCIDLTDPNNPKEWTKTFSDKTERWRAEISRQVVEEIRHEPEWKPPEYGQVKPPEKFGPPLNVNGDFEQGAKGWEGPDNCASFLEKDPVRGMVLRIRTDLPNDPWVEYHRNIRLGLTDGNHPPKLPRDTGYGSVAGLEGVHYCSDWIDATPLWRYWLVADVESVPAPEWPGQAVTPKIFVKGYKSYAQEADGLSERSLVERGLTPQAFSKLPRARQQKMIEEDAQKNPDRHRRECWRWYVNCTPGNAVSTDKDGWVHMAVNFPPRGGLPPEVKWLQIQIYPYWPPGEYRFDNVFIYKDPDQKAPLPEEKARTPNFGKVSVRDADEPGAKPASRPK